MNARLLRVLETVRAVREDTRAWVHHLTGEGPTTIRRQREAATQAYIAAQLATLARLQARTPVAPPVGQPIYARRAGQRVVKVRAA
jgi:hypothetical protein